MTPYYSFTTALENEKKYIVKLASILQQSYAKSVNFEPFYLFIIIYLTFANTDNKNIVRTQDCRITMQAE